MKAKFKLSRHEMLRRVAGVRALRAAHRILKRNFPINRNEGVVPAEGYHLVRFLDRAARESHQVLYYNGDVIARQWHAKDREKSLAGGYALLLKKGQLFGYHFDGEKYEVAYRREAHSISVPKQIKWSLDTLVEGDETNIALGRGQIHELIRNTEVNGTTTSFDVTRRRGTFHIKKLTTNVRGDMTPATRPEHAVTSRHPSVQIVSL